MEISRRSLLKAAAGGLIGGAAVACSPENQNTSQENVVIDPLVAEAPEIDQNDYLARVEKAKRLLAENRIDGLMITGGTALKYFGNVNWWPSERLFAMVILKEGNPVFVSPAFEGERALEQINPDYSLRTWEEDESPFELVKGIFTDHNYPNARVAIEERVRFFESDGLRKVAPNFEIVSGDPVTIGCRARKTAKELEIMRRANRLTVKVYSNAHGRLEAGMTENDTRQIFREEFRKLGVSGGAMVLHGENSAYPHGTKNRLPLKDGTVVLVDGGFKLNGYSSDISRTWVFGEPTQKQIEVWNVVKEAQSAALEAAKVGNTCGDVDAAARQVLTDRGYGPDYKYLTHRVGHGIGMDGHEWPYLVRGNSLPLAPGMTFSDEPGIYIYGEFGIRLEDIMYIDEDGTGKLFTEQSPSIHQPF